MKKYSLFFLLTTFACFADDNSQITSDDHSDQNFRVITPNAFAIQKEGMKFDINADFIYWIPDTFLRYEYEYSSKSNPIPLEVQQNYTVPIKSKYSPGFKVGIGMTYDHDGWDTKLEYTWYHTSTKDTTLSSGADPILAFADFLEPFTIESASLSPKFKYHFNNFNLELGRNFYLSHYLTLRPFAGLKGGWQKQSYVATWSADGLYQIDDEGNLVPATETIKVTNISKYWEIGLRAGAEATWFFTKNWGLFSSFSLSNQWLKNKSVYKAYSTTEGIQSYSDYLDNVEYLYANQLGDWEHSIVLCTELNLGLIYDLWMQEDEYRLRFQANWEVQSWSRYLTGLQGLTLKVQFDF